MNDELVWLDSSGGLLLNPPQRGDSVTFQGQGTIDRHGQNGIVKRVEQFGPTTMYKVFFEDSSMGWAVKHGDGYCYVYN